MTPGARRPFEKRPILAGFELLHDAECKRGLGGARRRGIFERVPERVRPAESGAGGASSP